MMDCRKYKRMLSAFAAGELEEAEAARLSEHLASCADCRGELAAYEEALSALRSCAGEPPEADEDFFRGLSERLDAAEMGGSGGGGGLSGGGRGHGGARPAAIRWHFVGSVAAAAAAVLIVATVMLPRIGGEGERAGDLSTGAGENAAAPQGYVPVFYLERPGGPGAPQLSYPAWRGEVREAEPFSFTAVRGLRVPADSLIAGEDSATLERATAEEVEELRERLRNLEARLAVLEKRGGSDEKQER